MKAALKTADGRFTVEEVDEPALPAADWVKARVHMAGICGTDLRHWEKPDQHLRCCIMGHELAGEVVEVGASVTRVRPGDRVLIESVLGCGHCDWCRVQQYNRCPDLYPTRRASVSRAYAEFVVGPQHKMHKLPDSIGFDDAALLDTYAVCLHAQHLSGLTIELLARGKLQTQKLISHRFPLDRINEAFETAKDKTRTGATFVGLAIA